jgi:hypothetical protein
MPTRASSPSFGLSPAAAALAASASNGTSAEEAASAFFKQTHDELVMAEREHSEISERVLRLKLQLERAKHSVDEASDAALATVRPCRVLTAYALWFFLPFVWPGAYLFYVGRDAQALLHTVSFGGFGLGWLVDAFYIPQYVADHNDEPGYRELAARRLRRWWSPAALALAPLTLLLQWALGTYVGLLGAYLVPRPAAAAAAAAAEDAADARAWLDRSSATTLGMVTGMLAAALALHVASTHVGRSRCTCRWWPLLGWTAAAVALLRPTVDAPGRVPGGVPDDTSCFPQLLIGVLGVMLGVAFGRVEAPNRAPKRVTRRRTSARLLVQLVGVGAFTSACLGAFYLNGSYTYTDMDSGDKVTFTGPEALAAAWRNVRLFSGEVSEGVGRLRAQYEAKSYADIFRELREAFRDPSYEAAEVLGVTVDATPQQVSKAYRKLAQQHHPDKVADPAQHDAAKAMMTKINWAKEVLQKR